MDGLNYLKEKSGSKYFRSKNCNIKDGHSRGRLNKDEIKAGIEFDQHVSV